MSLGKLKFHLLEAKFTHDTQFIGKMDPYGKFICREFIWKSPIDKNGSKKPKWENAEFEIEVKYMGDDIYYRFYDDDKGKDDKIADGCSKISTFCAEPHTDLWLKVEYKGKDAGSVHVVTDWMPNAPPTKEEHEDEMGKAQEAIKKLSERKNELQGEFDKVHADTEAHEAEYEVWKSELQFCDCGGNFDAAVAAAEEAFAAENARIEKERAIAQEAKEDFEKKMANQITEAAAARDAKVEESDAAHAKADEDKDAALADMESQKEAAQAAADEAIAAMEAEIEEQKAKDQEEYDGIAGEIKEIAEKLLALNEQLQEKLTALTQL